jgi:hypothetical protein
MTLSSNPFAPPAPAPEVAPESLDIADVVGTALRNVGANALVLIVAHLVALLPFVLAVVRTVWLVQQKGFLGSAADTGLAIGSSLSELLVLPWLLAGLARCHLVVARGGVATLRDLVPQPHAIPGITALQVGLSGPRLLAQLARIGTRASGSNLASLIVTSSQFPVSLAV